VFVEGDKVSQYAGMHLHKCIVNSHSYSKRAQAQILLELLSFGS